MAILFGTTADGESLPVQVNEFGQLVAQGVPGEQGIQGPPGPPGPVGDYTYETVEFVPTLYSSDVGEALIDWSTIAGKACRWGPIVWATFQLVASNVVVTNARGDIRIGGLPESMRFLHDPGLNDRGCVFFAPHFRLGGKTLENGLSAVLLEDGRSFSLAYAKPSFKYDAGFPWSDLDKGEYPPCIRFTWQGWHHSVASSAERLDDLMSD